MGSLIQAAGVWRSSNVGVFTGQQIQHMAPPKNKVPGLMEDLFNFLKKDSETLILIKACVFHYELEFIHPFTDGNGRMG